MFNKESPSPYQLLPEGNDQALESAGLITGQSKVREDRRRKTIYAIVIAFLVLSNILSVAEIIRLRSSADRFQLIFSPAKEAVDYEIVRFHSGPLNNEGDDIYSLPPSDEVDQAWRDLYEVGAIGLPKEMGPLLVNNTEKINSEGNLVIGIDVFHQLHCLNKIRKALYPDYYTNTTERPDVAQMHLVHCLNSVRQSLMCSSDISPVPFNVQTIEAAQVYVPKLLPTFNVVHSCRNFTKIKEWVWERWGGEYIDQE